MSTTENNIEETIPEEHTVVVPEVESNGLLTPNHLKNYPLVKSTRQAIDYIPLSKPIISVCGSTFNTVRSYQPLKYIVTTADKLTNRALEEIDRWFPSLQTMEVQDITTPITKPVNDTIEGVQTRITAINETVSKNVVEPTIALVDSAKHELHNKVYDSEGKGIITSKADPIVGPLNQTVEKFIETHLPEVEKVPQEGNSSELSRTFQLMGNIIKTKK